MDIFYYLELLAYKINGNENSKEEDVYIDQVSWL